MSKKESSFTSGRDSDSGRLEPKIATDLEALARRSAREFPTLDATVLSLRQKNPESKKEATFMSTIRTSKARPLLISASLIAVAVIALLAVPIPYDRTVGHDVTLKLDDSKLGQAQVIALAKEMKSRLGVDAVQVGAVTEGVGRSYELTAMVPISNGISPRRIVEAFASNLNAAGQHTTTEVSPRKERASTTVYALAHDSVIEISTDGKSAEQLEEEIRQALLSAGVTMAEVDVVNDSDGHQKVTIKVEREVEGGEEGASEECCPQIVLTSEGEPLDGQGEEVAVRIKKLADESGTRLIVEVVRAGQTVTAEVANPDGMSDEELASEIESALAQQGITANVSVIDGRIDCELVR